MSQEKPKDTLTVVTEGTPLTRAHHSPSHYGGDKARATALFSPMSSSGKKRIGELETDRLFNRKVVSFRMSRFLPIFTAFMFPPVGIIWLQTKFADRSLEYRLTFIVPILLLFPVAFATPVLWCYSPHTKISMSEAMTPVFAYVLLAVSSALYSSYTESWLVTSSSPEEQEAYDKERSKYTYYLEEFLIRELECDCSWNPLDRGWQTVPGFTGRTRSVNYTYTLFFTALGVLLALPTALIPGLVRVSSNRQLYGNGTNRDQTIMVFSVVAILFCMGRFYGRMIEALALFYIRLKRMQKFTALSNGSQLCRDGTVAFLLSKTSEDDSPTIGLLGWFELRNFLSEVDLHKARSAVVGCAAVTTLVYVILLVLQFLFGVFVAPMFPFVGIYQVAVLSSLVIAMMAIGIQLNSLRDSHTSLLLQTELELDIQLAHSGDNNRALASSVRMLQVTRKCLCLSEPVELLGFPLTSALLGEAAAVAVSGILSGIFVVFDHKITKKGQ